MYIYEPKKLALRYTTSDPTHIIKNIDVIIVLASLLVLNAKVHDNSNVSKNGPHKSPIFIYIYFTIH